MVDDHTSRPADHQLRNRVWIACVLGLAPLVGGCGSDEPLGTCSLRARESVGQLQVVQAAPSSELVVVDAAGSEVARGKTDAFGSLIFRKLAPGKGFGGTPASTALPPCPSLRGQQCRSQTPYVNTPAP